MSLEEDCKVVTLKLFINKTANKVVYAEAGKDFVDFLFHVLRLPLGATMKQLGSIGNVLKSVSELSPDLLISGVATQQALLSLTPWAIAPADSASPVPLWMSPPMWPNPKPFFTCSNPISKDHRRGKSSPKTLPVTEVEGGERNCPCCHGQLNTSLALEYVAPKEDMGPDGGYVKPRVPCMVTDDLVVKPLSTYSLVVLFNEMGVKDMGSLEERVVSVDLNQAKELLEALSKSKTVLSDTFLGKIEVKQ